MADFVNDAFKGAMHVAAEDEFNAYQKGIVEQIDSILTTAGFMVGLDKMDELAKAVLLSGQETVLADFSKYIAMSAFHIGYEEGRSSI